MQINPHQIKCDDTFISNSITPIDNIIAIESRKQRTIFTWKSGNQYINIEADKKNRYSCIAQDKDLICKKGDQKSLHTDFMHPTEILKNSK